MADIGKIWGVSVDNIGKIWGKDIANITNVWGQTVPHGSNPGIYSSNFYWNSSPYYSARCDFFDPNANSYTSLTVKSTRYGNSTNPGRSSRPGEGARYSFYYYGGGAYYNYVDIWNLSADTWSAATAGGDYGYGGIYTFDSGDTFYKCLMLTSAGSFNDDCDEYNSTGDSWTDKVNRGGTLGYCGVASMDTDDRCHSFSGNGGGWNTNSHVYYDVGSNVWGSLTVFPQTASNTTGGMHPTDDKLYSFGGRIYASNDQTWCYYYDKSANAWTTQTSLNYQTEGGGCGDPVVDDELTLTWSQHTGLTPATGGRTEWYDISANAWTNKAASDSDYRASQGWSST